MNTPDPKLLDHNYDGIQELDNPLPRWWLWLFILSIVFSVGYVTYYWSGLGKSIQEKFELGYASVTQQKNEENAKPVSITLSTETAAAGKAIFQSKCAACHGIEGGGGIGPNLADAHWKNGNGTPDAIFHVISVGVPEKGMIAWGPLLSETEIAELTSYIMSIKGSNPSNAKGPEGTEIH